MGAVDAEVQESLFVCICVCLWQGRKVVTTHVLGVGERERGRGLAMAWYVLGVGEMARPATRPSRDLSSLLAPRFGRRGNLCRMGARPDQGQRLHGQHHSLLRSPAVQQEL